MAISPAARDFIDRLLCPDTKRRLGAKGAEEVKAHAFLRDVDWDNLLTGEVSFVPQTADPEDTQYFDLRGATTQIFSSTVDEAGSSQAREVGIDAGARKRSHGEPTRELRARTDSSTTSTSGNDDFGAFSFRNLHVLKQANDDVVRKLRNESLVLQTDPATLAQSVDTPVRTRSCLLAVPLTLN